MTSNEKKYSAEFKIEVARKALDQSKKNLEGLSKKYDVPVSLILMWATELEKGGPEALKDAPETEQPVKEQEAFDVEVTNPSIADSIGHGVMFDRLNYKKLVFWSVFGMVLFIIFVQGLIEMYQTNFQVTQDRISSESTYYQAERMNLDAQTHLESFGVIDLEANTYNIPIDSAINKVAEDYN